MDIFKYSLEETAIFIDDVKQHQKAGQKNLIKKIVNLLTEIQEHPTTGTGQVEQLKGFGVRSVWSRRIDKKHRLTYEVFEQEKVVKLLSAYGHYED